MWVRINRSVKNWLAHFVCNMYIQNYVNLILAQWISIILRINDDIHHQGGMGLRINGRDVRGMLLVGTKYMVGSIFLSFFLSFLSLLSLFLSLLINDASNFTTEGCVFDMYADDVLIYTSAAICDEPNEINHSYFLTAHQWYYLNSLTANKKNVKVTLMLIQEELTLLNPMQTICHHMEYFLCVLILKWYGTSLLVQWYHSPWLLLFTVKY